MIGDWKKCKITDIAEFMGDAPFGTSIKNHDYTESGALVVQGKNISGCICNWSDRRYVSIEKYNSLPKSHCSLGDLIFPKVGTIGKVGFLTPFGSQKRYILSTNTMCLRPNEKIACSKYVYYYFASPKVSNLIHALNANSVQPVFNFTALKDFEILLPPLSEQHAIAHILGSLDDKIELNRQMNETLEGIARALFKSWFVDFDPLRAKMEGREPYRMDAETAALFPDGFEDSTLGAIPRGWRVKPLSNCASYLSRGVAPKYVSKSNIYALNQRAIRWWNVDKAFLKFHDPEKIIRNEAYIRKGDVVINSTGDGTIGRAYWFFHEARNLFADSHVTIVRTSPDVLLPELVVFYMETSIYQDIVYGHVTGSTGQLELNRSNLGKIPFLCPSIQIQELFSSRIAPLFALVYNNQQELNTLTALRDTLLPKLLSGEIRVNDAERAVGARV